MGGGEYKEFRRGEGGKQSEKHDVYRYIQSHTTHSFAVIYDQQASCDGIHTYILHELRYLVSVCIHVFV